MEISIVRTSETGSKFDVTVEHNGTSREYRFEDRELIEELDIQPHEFRRIALILLRNKIQQLPAPAQDPANRGLRNAAITGSYTL